MESLVKNLNFKCERIEAVDGIQLTLDFLKDKLDLKNFYLNRGRLPKMGEIACALSHYKAFELFLKTDCQFALILEDDVEFDPGLLNKVIAEAIEKSTLWDTLSFQLNHPGLPVKFCAIAQSHHIVQYFGHVVETGAYLINRKTAHIYMCDFFPISLPYDYFYNQP